MSSERGQSVSVFVVVVVFALLLVAGLVIDGGQQSAAARRAERTAAAAARAAADDTAAARLAGRQSDIGRAIAAARDRIGAEPGMEGNVLPGGDGSIRVETRTTVDAVFLSIIGIRTLSARGSAEVQLFDR